MVRGRVFPGLVMLTPPACDPGYGPGLTTSSHDSTLLDV